MTDEPNPKGPWQRVCLGLLVVGYLFVGYAWFGPQDLERTGRGYLVFWYAAFLARTFQFHAGIVFVLLTGACLVFRWKRLAGASVPLLLAALGPSMPSFFPHAPTPGSSDTIRVMSANLLYLNEDHQPIIDEILAAGPDVVLLQEYTDRWHEAIHAAISEAYPHAMWVTRSDAFGVAIYSKWPMEPDPNQQLDCGDVALPLLRALIPVNGSRIAFYSVHMVPPLWRLLPRMRGQFHALCDRLADETEASVLAGDFNFTDASVMHRAIRALGLTDAHQAAGSGRGATWPMTGLFRFAPGIRIDHVYVGRDLTVQRCHVGQGRGSDHRPIIVDIAVPANKNLSQ